MPEYIVQTVIGEPGFTIPATVFYELDGAKPIIRGVYLGNDDSDCSQDLNDAEYQQAYEAVLDHCIGRSEYLHNDD